MDPEISVDDADGTESHREEAHAPASERRLPAGRKAELVSYVNSAGEVTVAKLAKRFEVSTDTIRRDLDMLDTEGLLLRTHGGAVSLAAGTRPDTDLDVRIHVQARAKETIGRLAADLVKEGSVIMLNGGSTTLSVVRHLRRGSNLTVATNNLRIPVEISPAVFRDLYVFGGQVRTMTQTTAGPVLLPLGPGGRDIEVQFDIALIGVGAVSAKAGYHTSNIGDAAMIAEMMSRSTRVAILADSAKFERTLFARVAPLSAANYFVTDKEPPAQLATALRESGVEIIAPSCEPD